MADYPISSGSADHSDFEALAAGYALHALEPEDEQRLSAHLMTCRECARIVADTASMGAAFTELLDAVPPPPGLRERILAAATAAPTKVFQSGLQGRANALYQHVSQFVRSGVLGDVAFVNAQWNRRVSWRRAGPSPEREQALNWRLQPGSPGLIGEIGIHQIDLMLQYLSVAPTAVTGAGSVTAWRDGREVPDTVVCLFEFPPHTRATLRATLASSFGGAYVAFQGSNSSLLMKESRSWMVKEADSPLLGWEVYARKETVHDETGIAMVADATKLLQAGKEPGKDGSSEPARTPLMLALEQFASSVRASSPPSGGVQEGYKATAIALKANEAVLRGARVEIQI